MSRSDEGNRSAVIRRTDSDECYAFPMRLSRRDAKSVLTGIGTEIKRRRQKLGISQDMLATQQVGGWEFIAMSWGEQSVAFTTREALGVSSMLYSRHRATVPN
jgi:hypothetical protein